MNRGSLKRARRKILQHDKGKRQEFWRAVHRSERYNNAARAEPSPEAVPIHGTAGHACNIVETTVDPKGNTLELRGHGTCVRAN